ncbi:MAG: helix-hairpin-helix domain-containing protein [Clostridiales bacterium]|nr:helix-hairpin-helix domain-containing protein [Clostridiales bacterium]
MQNMLKLCTRGDYVIKLLNKYKVLFIFILLTVSSLIYSIAHQDQEVIEIIQTTELESLSIDEEVEIPHEQMVSTNKMVPVFICGAIKRPGVYEIREDSLIEEVVMKAGGFTEEANREATNLARVVTAHEQIYIPKVGEEIDKVMDSYDNRLRESESGRTNINTAEIQELEKLPGIGEVKASQIIAYRNEHGLFKNLEELKNVSGIGQKTYEALLEYITIE